MFFFIHFLIVERNEKKTCFCLFCSQCTPVLFSEIYFCKAGSTFPETGCVSMPTSSARTLRYEWLTYRQPNKLKLTDKLEPSHSQPPSDKLIGRLDKLFDRKSVRIIGWFLVSHSSYSHSENVSFRMWNYVPGTGRPEPLTLTSYVIFSLMLCTVPFPSFPWNQTSPDIWVTISYLFRPHSSHSDWN